MGSRPRDFKLSGVWVFSTEGLLVPGLSSEGLGCSASTLGLLSVFQARAFARILVLKPQASLNPILHPEALNRKPQDSLNARAKLEPIPRTNVHPLTARTKLEAIPTTNLDPKRFLASSLKTTQNQHTRISEGFPTRPHKTWLFRDAQ